MLDQVWHQDEEEDLEGLDGGTSAKVHQAGQEGLAGRPDGHAMTDPSAGSMSPTLLTRACCGTRCNGRINRYCDGSESKTLHMRALT